MKLNLNEIDFDQFLKNNPQFSKKQEKRIIVLSDGKNEIEVIFSSDQKIDAIPEIKTVEKTQQEKVNEAVKLHKMWLNHQKGGKKFLIKDYPKDFLKGMNLSKTNLSCADLNGADLTDSFQF